jgi:hypothetical protein
MLIENIKGTVSVPCLALFNKDVPSALQLSNSVEELQQYAEAKAKYETEKEAFLVLTEAENFYSQVTLSFSVAGVILDLIHSAVRIGAMVMPESPKLIKRVDKQFSDLALIADNEGSVEVPDEWITVLDKLFNDDSLFIQTIVHGEIVTKNTETKKAIPLKGKIIVMMPTINNALLQILPA